MECPPTLGWESLNVLGREDRPAAISRENNRPSVPNTETIGPIPETRVCAVMKKIEIETIGPIPDAWKQGYLPQQCK